MATDLSDVVIIANVFKWVCTFTTLPFKNNELIALLINHRWKARKIITIYLLEAK